MITSIIISDRIVPIHSPLNFESRNKLRVGITIRFLTRLNLKQPYLRCVATWEPRKNLELLIRTLTGVKHGGLLSKYKLVLVGGHG